MTDMTLQAPSIINVKQDKRAVLVDWADGHQSTFHYIWLRDNCPQLADQLSGQRAVDTALIPTGIHAETVRKNDAQELEVVWANDGHVSTFTPQWLRTHCYSNGIHTNGAKQKVQWQPKLWDANTFDTPPMVYYDDIMNNDDARRDWLTFVRDYGFVILRGAPAKDGMVAEFVNTFGYVRETSWGRYIDIKVEVNPNTVARTNHPLPSHTDDPYRYSVPSLILVQSLISNVTGGESTVVDGFKLADILRTHEPEKFKLLSTYPIHFHFEDDEHLFDLQAPVIRLNLEGEVEAIRYSNFTTQPFNFPPDVMESYYDAYHTFARMREDKAYQIRFQLEEGDIYMADNWRLLHGRTGFKAGGDRHIQVCFSERDGLYSQLGILNRKAQ